MWAYLTSYLVSPQGTLEKPPEIIYDPEDATPLGGPLFDPNFFGNQEKEENTRIDNWSNLTLATPATGAPITIGGKTGMNLTLEVNHTIDNYITEMALSMAIYKDARKTIHLDSSIPVSHAPIINLKTFSTDWSAKRKRPSPLDNYFLRPVTTWDTFGWDGMFMRTLLSKANDDTGILPEDSENSPVVLEFGIARDAQGRLWVPELLAIKYFEGLSNSSLAYVCLGPLWAEADQTWDRTNLPSALLLLSAQKHFGLIGVTGMNSADNQTPICDLRDNHGRGVIWPLRYLVCITQGSEQVQALVLFRYAPIEFDALLYVTNKYLRLNETAKTLATPLHIRGMNPLTTFKLWYRQFMGAGYDDDPSVDDDNLPGFTHRVPLQN